MKRFVRAWAVAALAVGVGTGCAGEQEALIVLHAVSVDDDCLPDISGGIILTRGRLDVSAGTSYFLNPVLENNLPSQSANTNNSGVDDSEVQLRDRVDITMNLPSGFGPLVDDDGERLPLDYDQPISTLSLSPGDQLAPTLDLIPAEYTRSLAREMSSGETVQATLDIRFTATRGGNSRGNVGVIEARLFTFPIELCDGCMLFSCDCGAADLCVPGTERYPATCRNTVQDFYGTPFDCAAQDAASSSDGGSTGGAPVGTTGAASVGTTAGTTSGTSTTGEIASSSSSG